MSNERLHDPFNPESGEFAKNIRAITGLDDSELKQSLRNYGWLDELPAIADENDVVLVGNRRLRLAKQLNIEPVIKKIKVGKGDEADAYRLKLALASNIGHQPLTKEDRKRIAEYLYGQKQWTESKIAEALDVSQMTVSRDLESLNTVFKPSRPKGGRPKGSGGGGKHRAPKKHYKETDIVALADKGMTMSEIAGSTGIGQRQVRHVIEREQIRREAKAEPDVTRADLSLSAQEKFDAAIRQEKKRLAIEFTQRVNDEVRRRIDEMVLPHWKEQIEQAKTLYERRRGAMDKETFNAIRRALHPDSRKAISDKKLGEAFDTFMRLEKYLLNEKDSPTDWSPGLPSNLAEWDKMRATKGKRPSGPTAVRRR